MSGIGTASVVQSETGNIPTTGDNITSNVTTAFLSSDNISQSQIEKLTLITGDIVAIDKRGLEPTYRLLGNKSATKFETRTGVHIVPEGVDLTKFDKSLFNIDLLREQDITDAESDSIPIIVEYTERDAMNDGVPTKQRGDIRNHRQLETVNGTAVSVSKSATDETYQRLASARNVKSVYYDATVKGAGTTPRSNIDLESAHDQYNVTGEDVTVAVLDTGINESHPDIGDSEVREIDLVDDGKTGDLPNHGTPAAGLITGDGTSNDTYVGVAPDADVIDVRVLDRTESGKISTVIDGVEYATQQDADVISMSFGIQPSTIRTNDPFRSTIKDAVKRDTTVVAAAGNNAGYGSITSPGTLRDVITVGSSVNESEVPSFSRQGPTPIGRYVKPDLVAPGDGVTAPDARTTGYRSTEGTSFSTPIVAGTAALLHEKHPGWSEQRVKNAITSTTDSLGSQDIYTQGSGELNVTAALSPDIVIDPTTIDFGQFPAGETVTKTVTVRNLGSERRQVNVSAKAVAIQSSDPGTVSVNRSSMTLKPGSTASLALTVNTTNDLSKPHSGRLHVGDTTAIFGYVPKRQVTVKKHGLGSIDGDRITLMHTKTNRVYGPKEFDGSTAHFAIEQPGEYVAVSSGRHNGQPVITAKSEYIDGLETIILDESQTVTQTVDTGTLPQSGDELQNRTVIVNATLDSGPIDERVVAENAPTAAVRISPTSDMNYAVRRVITAPQGEKAYNTSTVYHLKHTKQHVSGLHTVSIDVDDLNTHTVRYYKGTPDETYSATLAADDFDNVPIYQSYMPAGLGTIFNQTIYVSPTIAHYHDAFAEGSFGYTEWSATPQQVIQEFDNDSSLTTAVKKHPFRSKLMRWSLSEHHFNSTVFPTVGQPPNGYVISDSPSEQYDLWINGDKTHSFTENSADVPISLARRNISSVRLRVQDQHGMSPLSNNTVTTFKATTDTSDTRPPTVPSISFESHGRTNVVPTGSLNVTVSTSDTRSSVQNVTLYTAKRDSNGVPSTTPFANESNWEHVPLTKANSGNYTTTLELGPYRGTLSVAVRAVDDAGNSVETTATNAVVVGNRSPTPKMTANASLVKAGTPVHFDASGSYDDSSVSAYRWDFDGDGTVDETTADPTATHQYTQTGKVKPALTVADSQGFTNTTQPLSISVASSLPQHLDEIDSRTKADIQSAVQIGQIQVESRRLNGKQEIGKESMFVARGDMNGGFEGGNGSTIVIQEGRVNGHAEGHNVIARDTQFNGGVEATGTVTATQGSVTARGGIEASESITVLPDTALTVRGGMETKELIVEENSSLVIHGKIEVDEFILENGSSARIWGSLHCNENSVEPSATVNVNGENGCMTEDMGGQDNGQTEKLSGVDIKIGRAT